MTGAFTHKSRLVGGRIDVRFSESGHSLHRGERPLWVKTESRQN
jgi:hypothetical protein